MAFRGLACLFYMSQGEWIWWPFCVAVLQLPDSFQDARESTKMQVTSDSCSLHCSARQRMRNGCFTGEDYRGDGGLFFSLIIRLGSGIMSLKALCSVRSVNKCLKEWAFSFSLEFRGSRDVMGALRPALRNHCIAYNCTWTKFSTRSSGHK